MSTRRKISTTELRAGYILEEDILNNIGMVLIARGTSLDDYLIRSIRNLEISEVYINEDSLTESETYSQPEKVSQERPPVPEISDPIVREKILACSVRDRATLELTEIVKERVRESVTQLFGNPDSADFAGTARAVTDDLMRALLENNAIAIDIGILKISDEYTFKHSVDVASLSMIIGKKYGLGDDEVYELGIAGLLHDIGKARIQKEILNKPSKLTEDEFVSMKRHSYYSYDIIRKHPEFGEKIRLAVLEHHEKMNGSGYPLKLEQGKISLYARIIAVADVYDALVSDRPYKKAYSKKDAIEMIMAMTNELDIEVMQAFLKSVILYPVGSNIYLSNGEWARVVENNPFFLLRPKCIGIESGRLYDLAADIACANIIVQD